MNILFNFSWDDFSGTCSVNDVIRHWLKGNGYEWAYDQHGRLVAYMGGEWRHFDYTGSERGGFVELVTN